MISSIIKLSLVTILAAVITANALAAPTPLARDLSKLTDWFEGHFDNEAQVWFENDRRWIGSDDEKHRRNHATHIRINAPQFGEHVFYVEEYMDDDIRNIWRQRIVSFDIDTARGLRMKLYFIKDSKKYNTDNAAELLAELPTGSATNIAACDVWFTRLGEQYHGSMDGKSCVFGEGKNAVTRNTI